MNQTVHNAMLRENLQMLARLAETRAPHEHGSDPEFTVDEMIEWNIGRRDVAARVGGGELDTEAFPLGVVDASEKRLDGLSLYQGDFAPTVAGLFRVEPGPGEIAIALQSAPRERPHFLDRLHRRGRFRRDMDGDDGTFPHATILACFHRVLPEAITIHGNDCGATERMTDNPSVEKSKLAAQEPASVLPTILPQSCRSAH